MLYIMIKPFSERSDQLTPIRSRWGAHGIREKVVLPSERLHEEYANKSANGCLLKNFMVIRDMRNGIRGKCVVFASTENKVLDAFERSCLVVGIMRGAPSIVQHQNELKLYASNLFL